MSMKDLVAGQCGGANPLVQLANKVHSGNVVQREVGIQRQTVGKTSLDDETLSLPNAECVPHVPQTFDMQALLSGMSEIDLSNTSTSSSHNATTSIPRNDIFLQTSAEFWQEEFLDLTNFRFDEPAVNMNESKLFNYSSIPKPLPTSSTTFPMPPFLPPMLVTPQPPLQHHGGGRWAHEYLDEVDNNQTTAVEGVIEGARTAIQVLESFEKKIEKAKSLTQNSTSGGEASDLLADAWVKEYTKEEGGGDNEEVSELKEMMEQELEDDVEYWQKLQQEWTEMFSDMQEHEREDLMTSHDDVTYGKQYEFEKDNPFQGMSGAFEKGLEKLDEGDLISAILLFEEAVQHDPDHVEAWRYLGTSQAENEQEVLAINALNKCLELQPDHLVARMSLAVSYTNEYLQTEAYKALKAWIQHHPAYSHLVNDATTTKTQEPTTRFGSAMLTNPMSEELQHLYLSAARSRPQGDIDADVQLGLGVLFNLTGDYEKAVDCFRTALGANPDNAATWNKLGATLANGGRSAEAVEAYRRALDFRPGFIRCRYNLGISCVNLKCYGKAVEHFLNALSMQRQGEDPSRPVSTMSENIWSTLRMTISLLGRLDLMTRVDKRDLAFLCDEFKIETR